MNEPWTNPEFSIKFQCLYFRYFSVRNYYQIVHDSICVDLCRKVHWSGEFQMFKQIYFQIFFINLFLIQQSKLQSTTARVITENSMQKSLWILFPKQLLQFRCRFLSEAYCIILLSLQDLELNYNTTCDSECNTEKWLEAFIVRFPHFRQRLPNSQPWRGETLEIYFSTLQWFLQHFSWIHLEFLWTEDRYTIMKQQRIMKLQQSTETN